MFKNMSCNEIHAFRRDNVFCPLHEHLFNTLLGVTNTSLINRLKVISNRLRNYFEKIDTEILLLPPLLHDIGKVLSTYQTRGTYYLHEFIGGVIVYKLLSNKEELCNSDNKDFLKLLIYPIIYHHYSMRDLSEICRRKQNIDLLKDSVIDFNKVSIVLKCLINEINNHRERIIETVNLDKVVNLLETMLNTANNLKSIQIGKELNKYYRELVFHKSTVHTDIKQKLLDIVVNVNASALTGLVNISDYLIGSIERTHSDVLKKVEKSFVSRVLSRSEVEKLIESIKRCEFS